MASAPGLAAGSTGGEELSDLSTFSAPLCNVPTLLPSVVGERPRWLLPLVASMAAAMVVMVGLWVFLVTKPADEPVGAATLATAPTASPQSVPLSVPAAKQIEPVKAAATTEKKEAEKKAEKIQMAARSKRPKRKMSRRPAKRDELDLLFDTTLPRNTNRRKAAHSKRRSRKSSKSASSRRRAAKPSAANSSRGRPRTLSRRVIQKRMLAIKSKVQGCYDRDKVPGKARIKVVIHRNGKVARTTVKGVFASSPTGKCVKRAASSARFPRFKGRPITITYPFTLT